MNLPVSSMTAAEKISAMEELWTSLQGDANASPPDWHGQILAERQKRIDCGEATFCPLDEVRERLETRYK